MEKSNLTFVKCVELQGNANYPACLSISLSEKKKVEEGVLTVYKNLYIKDGYKVVTDNGKKYATIVLPLSELTPKQGK